MLSVYTQHADEQSRLEEQFPLQGATYRVPPSEAGTLEAIIRAITFEHFQNNPPLLVQKIMEFANCATHSTISLTLFREIVAAAHQQHSLICKYKQHRKDLDSLLECDQDWGFLAQEERSGSESNQHLFQRAALGQMRETRLLDNEDYQQSSVEMDLSIKIGKVQAHTENTTSTSRFPLRLTLNPEAVEGKKGEGEEKTTKLGHFLCSAQNYYGIEGEWWKADKGSDQSKQISKFDVRGNNILSQKSFGKLVVEEQRYDLNREIELGRDINKHEELEGFRYNRMMKDKRLSAKLKKRSVKKK